MESTSDSEGLAMLIMAIKTIDLTGQIIYSKTYKIFCPYLISSTFFFDKLSITEINPSGRSIKKSGSCCAKISWALNPQLTAITFIWLFLAASISLVSSPT